MLKHTRLRIAQNATSNPMSSNGNSRSSTSSMSNHASHNADGTPTPMLMNSAPFPPHDFSQIVQPNHSSVPRPFEPFPGIESSDLLQNLLGDGAWAPWIQNSVRSLL
jgi:hypothetical protein